MDRGQRAIMVGYGVQNGKEVYRMYKMDTRKITLTRDVRWRRKMYGEISDETLRFRIKFIGLRIRS